MKPVPSCGPIPKGVHEQKPSLEERMLAGESIPATEIVTFHRGPQTAKEAGLEERR